MATISSQRYLDDDVVSSKRIAGDFTVYTYEVGDWTVIVDGHHSLAAARLDGAEPAYRPVSRDLAAEYDHQVLAMGIDGWLEAHQSDSDWYYVDTGCLVF